MNHPSTNYLRNTAPGSREQFIELLGKLELFKGLPRELRSRIFDYAKFVPLSNHDRPVKEGMFDQEIYLLLQGQLDVFISLGDSQEKQIDSLGEPFTLFGERCILGQPRGASIQASGEVLLLGLDLSSLPDLLEGLEDPAKRLEDGEYEQNLDMYLVVAQVLFGRLERLIYDQHKLSYKARGMLKSASIHKKAVLTTRLFNELVENHLQTELRQPRLWQRFLRDLGHRLRDECVVENQVDSRRVYEDLVAQQALGRLPDQEWLYQLLKRLRESARYLPGYKQSLQSLEDLPEVMMMARCLGQLHQRILSQANLPRPVSLEELLAAQDERGCWSPSALIRRFEEQGLFTSHFAMAHLALLLCEALIEMMGAANQVIASTVSFLGQLHVAPRQRTHHAGGELAEQFAAFFKSTQSNESAPKTLEPKADNAGVDDLLASFGL
ncbi:MAG: cyclic nucleotide-binding domain-containing protein [bacterium]|nr:cyclic nucleotide-binding domain-containing protein [bacterium]